MKAFDIMEALTDMDEDVLLRAEQDPPKRLLFPGIRGRSILTYAAVLALVVAVTVCTLPFVTEALQMRLADRCMEQTLMFSRLTEDGKEISCSLELRHSAKFAEAVIDDQSGLEYRAVMDAVVYRSDGTVRIVQDTFVGTGDAVIRVENLIEELPGTVYLVRVQLIDPVNGYTVFQILNDLDSLGLRPPAGVDIVLPPTIP